MEVGPNLTSKSGLAWREILLTEMEREVAATKAWTGTQRVTEQPLLKQVSRSSSNVINFSRLGTRVFSFLNLTVEG